MLKALVAYNTIFLISFIRLDKEILALRIFDHLVMKSRSSSWNLIINLANGLEKTFGSFPAPNKKSVIPVKLHQGPEGKVARLVMVALVYNNRGSFSIKSAKSFISDFSVLTWPCFIIYLKSSEDL